MLYWYFFLIIFSILMYIMCVILCLFSTLSCRVGALQISIIIIDQVSSEVSTQLYSTLSGSHLYYKMIGLVQKHYDLASTTVTGIPMKVGRGSVNCRMWKLLGALVLHFLSLPAFCPAPPPPPHPFSLFLFLFVLFF